MLSNKSTKCSISSGLDTIRFIILVNCICLTAIHWTHTEAVYSPKHHGVHKDEQQDTDENASRDSGDINYPDNNTPTQSSDYDWSTKNQKLEIFFEEYDSLNISTTEDDTDTLTAATEDSIVSGETSSMKYVLLWTGEQKKPLAFSNSGQKAFIDSKCSYTNCYVTTKRNLFADITMYDAVAFNNVHISKGSTSLPAKRSPLQKYIFFSDESPRVYPICEEVFDGFFNWTVTYKLDSDVPYPYIRFKSKTGEETGPRRGVQWLKEMTPVDDFFEYSLQTKTRAAAGVSSHCFTGGRRIALVRKIDSALAHYGLKVDYYGRCTGSKMRPANHTQYRDEWGEMLRKDYYFYLSFENSYNQDYVTENLYIALTYDMVPIVFGGVDYSRFLPPSSYVDASKMTFSELARVMNRLIKNPHLYLEYFKWKNHYTYYLPMKENVCALCAALNDENMMRTPTVYYNIRYWWNPRYEVLCNRNKFTVRHKPAHELRLGTIF